MTPAEVGPLATGTLSLAFGVWLMVQIGWHDGLFRAVPRWQPALTGCRDQRERPPRNPSGSGSSLPRDVA